MHTNNCTFRLQALLINTKPTERQTDGWTDRQIDWLSVFICCDGRHTETAKSSQTTDTTLSISTTLTSRSLNWGKTKTNKQNIKDITVSTSAIAELWGVCCYTDTFGDLAVKNNVHARTHFLDPQASVQKHNRKWKLQKRALSVLVVECCQSTCALTANYYSVPLRDWKYYPKFILGCSSWMFWVKRLKRGLLSLLYKMYNLKLLDNFATLQYAPCTTFA